jgi:hypothetical protein
MALDLSQDSSTASDASLLRIPVNQTALSVAKRRDRSVSTLGDVLQRPLTPLGIYVAL